MRSTAPCRRPGHIAAVVLAGLAPPGGSAWGQCEAAKLLASDGAGGDRFGISVAISSDGTTALVGAAGDDDGGDFSGSVYVLVRSGALWDQQVKLTASDAATLEVFGFAVALAASGSGAVVGAPQDGTGGTGSAYVFTRDGVSWIQHAKLVASNAEPYDHFGYSVAISADGTTVLVGGPDDDDACPANPKCNSGAVHVFGWDGGTWVEQAKVTASDANAGDRFGTSVGLSADGTVALIGAPESNVGPGSAYVFVRSGATWVQESRLTGSDGALGDFLGHSVALSGLGDTALIGAFGDDAYRGSAYVFVRSGSSWTQQGKLLAEDGAVLDRFGHSVAVSAGGNVAVVGAYQHSPCATACIQAGAAYVFGRSGSAWTQTAKLTASDATAFDSLGFSVDASDDGDSVLVGAVEPVTQPGSAYVFDLDGTDCNENVVCDARELAEGTATDNNGTGVLDECEGDLDGNGTIGVIDFLILLAVWGPCRDPPASCPADLDHDGAVGIVDMLMLLGNWF